MAIDWTRFPLGKPVRRPRRRPSARRKEKAARHATQSAVIAATRLLVFALDSRCPVCLKAARDDDEMHEVVPRSKTRGLPPEERFNRRNCVRLHRSCHRAVTEHRIELAFLDPAEGVDGGLLVQQPPFSIARLYERAPTGRKLWWQGIIRKGRWDDGRDEDEADGGDREEADGTGAEADRQEGVRDGEETSGG